MKVYLVGMMGSGKSTVGKKLALRLGYTFYDLDEQIEESTGRTINEIFEEDGESSFRVIEAMALKNLSLLDDFVMSTGGGTPCFHNNIRFIRKSGPSFYLKADAGFLASRLGKSDRRPLLQGLSGDEVKKKLSELLAERKAVYERAIFKMDAKNIGPDQIELMVKMMGKR